MAEGGEDVPFVRALLDTGIDGYKPKFTNLIVFIKNTDGTVIWKDKYQTSESHVHAEIQMLNDKVFKDEIEKVKDDKTKKTEKTKTTDKTEKVDIILTLNYSPCSECADKLIEFYEVKKSLIRKFTIRFSRLYRINIQANIDGLKDLNSAGITLKAMTEKSWCDVLMPEESSSFEKVMKLYDLDPVMIRKRDLDTRKTLQELLGKDQSDSSDESDSSHESGPSHESESSDSDAQLLVSDMEKLKFESDSD